MNDTNDKIYEIFESVVNESAVTGDVHVAEDMLKHGSFVAKINIRGMHRSDNVQNAEVVEFDPITIHWPDEMVDDREALDKYEGNAWQIYPKQIAQPRPTTELSSTLYFGPYQNATQARNIRLKLQAGQIVPKLARFRLKRKTATTFDAAVRNIESFLAR